MLLSLFGCVKKESGNKGVKDPDVAVWSETTEVSKEMFVYFYNAYYRYFIEEYNSNLPSLGLDPTKSLSSQRQSENYTWQQYFVIQVYDQLREMVALADAAKADKIKLSKDDKEDIKKQLSLYETYAKDAGVTVDEYVETAFGSGVTLKVMEKAFELRFLANRYYKNLYDGYEFSDDECLAYYEKNSDGFIHYDYIKITVYKEDVPMFEECTDEASFVEAVRKAITQNNFLGDYDRFKDTIEAQVKRKFYYRASHDPNYNLSQWAVDPERKAYDIYQKTESSGNVTVAMILPTDEPGAINEVLYRDDLPLKNLKYIVFADGEGTEGKVKAESIYKNWLENPTAERFDELVAKYEGGIAENVARGDFNDEVNTWVFSQDRKVGDCGIVEVDGGAYLLYVLEDGVPSWLKDVRESMKEEQYEKDLKKIIEKHPTEYNPEVVYNIVEVKVKEAETTAAQ